MILILLWLTAGRFRKRDTIAALKPLSAEWSPVNVVSKEYADARH